METFTQNNPGYPQAGAQSKVQPRPAAVKTVLVVDDNGTNRFLATEVLRYFGYRTLDVGSGLDAALADQRCAFGRAGGEALGGGEVDRQGAEVAVVDAEEGAAHMDGTLELALVVDLDQHVETDPDGSVVERPQLIVAEGGGEARQGQGRDEVGRDHPGPPGRQGRPGPGARRGGGSACSGRSGRR